MAANYVEALEHKLDFERQWLRRMRVPTGAPRGAPDGWDAGIGNEYYERAEVFYVSRDIQQLIGDAARKLPTDGLRLHKDMLPAPCGFVWLESDTTFEFATDDNSQKGAITCRGLEWMVSHEGRPDEELFVIAITRDSTGRMDELALFAWPWDTDQVNVERAATNLLKSPRAQLYARAVKLLLSSLFLFVQQKILVPSAPQPIDRGARRRAERAGQVVRGVRVVELRKKQHLDPSPAAEGQEVEWSCRWLVRGHWRQQLYPSTGRHQPVWIAPYVKGPDDKPVRAPRHQIFAVVR